MNRKHCLILLFAFLIISLESAYAQNGLKGRHNIKASHSYFSYQNAHFFQLEYNRGVFKFMELGSYFSTHPDYYPAKRINPVTSEPIIIGLRTRAYYYGLQTNLHPLQLFINEGHRFRLDLYINAKLGGLYSPVFDDSLRPKEHYFVYDIGAGLAYHLFKHWGVFMEYNYRSYANFRYGFSIKF